MIERATNRSEAEEGFSLVEMLVVVAMIGILSLVAVPNFISMMNATKMNSTMRQVAADFRAARQRAVTKAQPIKVSFTTATGQGAVPQRYRMYDCTAVTAAGVPTCSASPLLEREIDVTIYFSSTNFVDKEDPSGTDFDVIFKPDGTLTGAPNSPYFHLKTDKKIPYNTAKFTFSAAGTLTTAKTSS